jgi:acyl carrier protein
MEIADSVRRFLTQEAQLLRYSEHVDDHPSLMTSGLLDSLDQIRLVTFLERAFNIAIEAEDVEAGHLETIASIEQFVRSKSSGCHKWRMTSKRLIAPPGAGRYPGGAGSSRG